MKEVRESAGKPRALLRIILVGTVLAGGLCIAYGYFVEPYWPEITQARIDSPRLPPGSRPLRIVQISDLHSDPGARLEERLPDLISELGPDVIVYTGDSINSPDGLPVFKRCLTRIAAIAPTFVVRGNWDTWYWGDLDLFGGTGAQELDGHAERLEIGGSALWVAGIAVGNERMADAAVRGISEGEPLIFLYHYPYPDALPRSASRRIDLYCTGHTHGGQVALPLYGAIITLSKYGKKYEAGLYRIDGTFMYVNRGIGLEGGMAPRVRFFARPEITLIEMIPRTND